MAIHADYVVVGTGITGATIARCLADAGRDVLVVDRREHIGGNVHDFEHSTGIRIHTYGPHYFRTNSDRIWEFANRFSAFHAYRAIVHSWVDGRYETWPVTRTYIDSAVGPNWNPVRSGLPSNFEEACLSMMPRIVYDKFVSGYTQKQWGVHPSLLGKELARRFEISEDNLPFFSRHTYQGIPANGYASFMTKLLEGIPRILNFDYVKNRGLICHKRKLIFTGPIDEYFGFAFGKLKYRGQRRVHEFLPSQITVQPSGQLNNPDLANGTFIRTLEWKYMMPNSDIASKVGTVITREYPFTPELPDEYEYPFPDEYNRQLYELYRDRANLFRDTLICGRLGEYRYYDMDQAMARALLLSRQILGGDHARAEATSPVRAHVGI